MQRWPTTIRVMMIAGVVGTGMLTTEVQSVTLFSAFELSSTVFADEPAPAAKPVESEAARRAAAVTLNYARASFHRIRRSPTLQVMEEEQQKILNHLNLNGIADEEVLKLYSSVLDEIAQIQLSGRERTLLKGKHTQQFQANLAFNALALTLQMATAQYASAVKTGASSWWDYRGFETNRDLEIHRIEKERVTKLVEKSLRFLDVSWKMARDKQIPDRWLVRGDDLDKLEEVCKEPNPEIRLRVLKRMEPFMECYPPYWYYVARTEQALGKLPVAANTFHRMAQLGEGHFRKDEMLSAGLANRALILSYLSDPEAPATARKALAYSQEVWEANLICAAVLQRNRDYDDAEDAILRNIDVDLEKNQSHQALVSLYYDSDNREKLAAQLSDLQVVRTLPAVTLARCASKLGAADSPVLLTQVMERSLQAMPRYNLGKDDLVIQATSNWQLDRATRIRLAWGDGAFINPRMSLQGDAVVATFEGIGELNGRTDLTELALTMEYQDAPPLTITLALPPAESTTETGTSLFAARRTPVYRVAGYQHEQMKLSLVAGAFRDVGATDAPRIAQPPTEELSANRGLSQARTIGNTTFKPVLPMPTTSPATESAERPYFVTPEIALPGSK